MAAFETILFEKRGRLACVTLNRPRVLNAFNLQMRDDLWEALFAVGEDPDVGALLLRGAGEGSFCAGADLTEFETAPSQAAAKAARWARDVFGRLRSLAKPTVAALHGQVIGSGVELAMLCDLRIAGRDAVFSMPETALGLIPAAGGTQTIPRAIGVARAMDMLLAGRTLTAGEAQKAGLVHRVVPERELEAAARRFASFLAALDPAAASGAKRALRAAEDLPLAEGLEVERRIAAMLAQRKDRGAQR